MTGPHRGCQVAPDVGTDQILYNLTRRGRELNLLPWLGNHGIAMMAYSPVEQGRLLHHETLRSLASRRGVSTAQLALAEVLRLPGIITIPKAGSVAHVHDNRAAADLDLSDEWLAEFDTVFLRPAKSHALEML